MTKEVIQSLKREKKRMLKLVTAIDHIFDLHEKGEPVEGSPLQDLCKQYSPFMRGAGFPYFGSNSAKISYVLDVIGRFAKKEEIIQVLQEYQPDSNISYLASIISRMVKGSRLVSLKYNKSNLYVFYGLPSFLNEDLKSVKEENLPPLENLKSLKIESQTITCGPS